MYLLDLNILEQKKTTETYVKYSTEPLRLEISNLGLFRMGDFKDKTRSTSLRPNEYENI